MSHAPYKPLYVLVGVPCRGRGQTGRARTALLNQGRHEVDAAAHFEGANRLEVLSLDIIFTAEGSRQCGRLQERGGREVRCNAPLRQQRVMNAWLPQLLVASG